MPPATQTHSLAADPTLRWRVLATVGAGVMASIYRLIFAGAPEREPGFEPWAVLLRGLSLVLVAVVMLFVTSRRARR